MFYVYIPDFNRRRGLSKDHTATILLTAGIAGLLCRIIWTLLFTKLPNLKGVLIFSLSCLLSGVSMGCVTFMTSYGGVMTLSCFTVASITGISATLSLTTIQVFGLDRATFVFGLFMLMDGVGCLAGPPIAGK